MPKPWTCALLLLPLCSISAQEPLAKTGEVSLPLADFQSIWTELGEARRRPQPEVAPFPSVISSALVEVQPLAHGVKTRTIFEINALNDRWQSIPLLPATTAVLGFEPADAAFAVQDKSLCLISNKTGKQTVVVESVEAGDLEDGQLIRLTMPAAASVILQIRDDSSGREPIVQGCVSLGEGKYAVKSGGAISVRLVPRESVSQKEQPARWKAFREVFATFHEDKVEMVARVVLRLEENGGWGAVLILPAAARVTDVKSEDLAGSRVEPYSASENRLVVRWSTPNVVQREILISLTLPAPLDSKWRLEPPLLEGEKDPTAWFGLVSAGDFEVSRLGEPNLPAGAEPGLWLQKAGNGKTTHYAFGKPGIAVLIKAPSVLATPVVTCPVLDAKTRLVADGDSVSELTYTLRHEPGVAARMVLPKGASLLSCRVANQPAQAVREADGSLRIRLSGADRETMLSISYHQKGAVWDPLRGACSIQLPLASLMVERILWKVAFPERFELEAFEGNVASAGVDGSIVFQKELCNEEAPFAELFYKKQEL